MKRFLFATVAFTIVAAPFSAQAAGNPNPGVVMPPQAHPFGETLDQWVGEWLTWSLEVPASKNTVFREDTCNVGQGGKVFFLPTSISLGMHYDCTVPAGTHILACPGLGVSFLGLDAQTEPALRRTLEEFLSHLSTVRMSIDGRRLDNLLDQYFVISPALFSVRLPNDAIFGLPPGPREILGGGVCTMLHPMSVGTHTVRMFDAFDDGSTIASSVSHITVVPR